MARIYNQQQYGEQFQGSAQSRGFNPVAAIDTSNQEKQRTQQQLNNLKREEQILNRDAALNNTVLRAQQAAERANFQAQSKTISGLLSLSQTALKAGQLYAQEQEANQQYQDQLDAEFLEPEDGYELGEVSFKAQESADNAADFSQKQIAIGQATVEASEGDAEVQAELHRDAQKQGAAVNVQRQNAYQASNSVGVFLNEFMDSDVTITRPDGSTFTPATAESEADLRAALNIAKREFATGAGIEKMNRAAVQRNLIPATSTATKAILRERGKQIREAQEQAALDSVSGTLIDGVLAGEDPRTLFDEAFAGLVGVGGRTKGQASKDALAGLLDSIVKEGSQGDFDALKEYTLSSGHTLGKGVTGQMIREAEDKFLDRIHNDNVRTDRAAKVTLDGYKEDRYRELIEAGADPEKIRAVEEKYIGLARELGGADALKFEKSIMAGGTSDSTVAFDLLMDQAQQGDLTEEDVRDAFDAGILNSTQLNSLTAIVGNEAKELDAKVKPHEPAIKRLAKSVTTEAFGESMNLMGGSKDENAAIEDDITRTITARVREFISLNPGIEQDPGRISQYADKVKTDILNNINNQKALAEERGIDYNYRFSSTPSLAAAKLKVQTSEVTGRKVRDFRQLSTYDLQQAQFNNTDDDKTNDINPVSDILFNRKDILQYAELYREGGMAALPDRVKVVAGAVGDMNPRVLIEQQAQAHGISVDLKSYIREAQAKGLNLDDLPTPDRIEEEALNVIGTYESDGAGGYDAVNQYGAEGGHSTGAELGMYSGRFSQMSQHGGRELTSMTLQEIMDLQSDDGSLTNDQWRDAGRLHAVGRYQFIGSTLKAIVQQSGIDPNTQFTPEVQDAMALYLLRTATSGIGQWVGPATHATVSEKEIVRAARLLESGKATKAQLVRIAQMFS